MKTNVSRSLILAWAALLMFVLGVLTWVSFMPGNDLKISNQIPTAVDLQLPDAMPVDKIILKDKEQKEDSGGSAKAEPVSQLAENQLEQTKHGDAPALGTDVKGPVQLYAAAPVETDKKIKVALVFSNLGRNDSLVDKILESTPSGVTLAYLPYTKNLKNSITTTRKRGHEVLLNLPMEPADYPNTDPGPNTLLTGLTPEQNIERLKWAMAQGQDYVGIMNLHGSLFLSSSQDLNPILAEIDKHGLLFMEAEVCYRSQVSNSSAPQGLPRLKSQFVINQNLTPAELQSLLIRAEQMAQETGLIILVVHSSPSNVPTMLTWIKKAQEQNYAFIPVTQLASLSTAHNGGA